eukprot:CAMPEP_0204003670 /NCGR_PEP_ID=MMETSP0360-20130528/17841_1 /ASSEMBLY_ACC=CAM_ASM_000342 /TAXON_ID=268821 /ORGANISM="Scrippsiella Hangoei, Strain SHTV-5" /LENGTH=60 /DNA_ID=CAMNT_0050945435 /DNA_START=63 /DNA_END=245 /DNA_ORIENTATION=-
MSKTMPKLSNFMAPSSLDVALADLVAHVHLDCHVPVRAGNLHHVEDGVARRSGRPASPGR